MLFLIPFFWQKAVIGMDPSEIPTEKDIVPEMVKNLLFAFIPCLIIITFPLYSSCLLVPVFLGNIDQNNVIFILTRKYSRQSLFLAKMVVNSLFTLFFAVFSFLALWAFTWTISHKYVPEILNDLFLNVGGMIVIFVFTIQVIVTTVGFFFQKRAMMWSILIALLFAVIFIVVNFVVLTYIPIGKSTVDENLKVLATNKLRDLFAYILIPLGMFIVLGGTSICLGLTKYKKVNHWYNWNRKAYIPNYEKGNCNRYL